MDVLPDSRARDSRGAIMTPMGYMVPIFCANCGVKGGLTFEENMTFLFWQCNPCFAKYGQLTNTMVMPDEVYWQKLRDEQMERYHRLLSNEELLSIVEADATPLATLIKTQGR